MIINLCSVNQLYVPKRLMYGIVSAPGIFQREMENIFGKLKM